MDEEAYLDGFIAAARGGRQAQHTELALLLPQLFDSQNHIAVSLGSVALVHNQTDDLLVGANTCRHAQIGSTGGTYGGPATDDRQAAMTVVVSVSKQFFEDFQRKTLGALSQMHAQKMLPLRDGEVCSHGC